MACIVISVCVDVNLAWNSVGVNYTSYILTYYEAKLT